MDTCRGRPAARHPPSATPAERDPPPMLCCPGATHRPGPVAFCMTHRARCPSSTGELPPAPHPAAASPSLQFSYLHRSSRMSTNRTQTWLPRDHLGSSATTVCSVEYVKNSVIRCCDLQSILICSKESPTPTGSSQTQNFDKTSTKAAAPVYILQRPERHIPPCGQPYLVAHNHYQPIETYCPHYFEVS